MGLAQQAHAVPGVSYLETFATAAFAYNGTAGTQTFLTTPVGSWSYGSNGYVHGASAADAEVWLDADRGSPNLSFVFSTATALTGVTFGFDGYFCGGCKSSGTTVAFSILGPGGTVLSQTITDNHLGYTGTLGTLGAGTYTFTWDSAADSNYRFDNFSLKGVAAPVPEPSTVALMLGGVALIGAARRKAQSNA